MIIIFMLWAFRPMYLTFKEFIEKFPKKKSKPQQKPNLAFFILWLCYFFIFIVSIFIFLESVIFLRALVNPLVLSFSIIASAVFIIVYHHFSKREFKGPLWSFSKFFFVATIILFFSVVFFSSYGLSKGINLEPQNVSFEVYVVNNALTNDHVLTALNYSRSLWSEYNLTTKYNSITYTEINFTSEEVLFLFNNGSNSEECIKYNDLIDKITNEHPANLSIIFLNNINSKHAGRGCLCNCSFALISPERFWIFDFTGWNVAHEIGHVLGLSDMPYEGRFRENLMNDETKKLLFYNSNFLDQTQLNNVVNKSKSLKLNNNLAN
jgi:hypothetical protein